MEKIRQRLSVAFEPTELHIVDESHQHAGHEGAKSGGGHYVVRIRSKTFAGKSPIDCHRLVYSALGEMMQGEIHALKINASGE